MGNPAPGSQGVAQFCIVGGAIYYSLDQGATWTEALAPGSPGNSALPVSGNGTVGTPFTVAAGALPLTAIAHQADETVAGNVSGGAASPVALTATQLTALINPATASLPGAMTAAQLVTLANTGGSFAEVAYCSNIIDMTAIASFTLVPTAPVGFVFVPLRLFFLTTAVTGSISTTATVSIGGGSTSTSLGNGVTTFPATAQFAALYNYTSLAISSFTSGTLAYTYAITTGATGTGGFAWSARVGIAGYWQPVP